MHLLWTRPLDHPIHSLILIFVAWKALLLLIAACSPGPGYDTSASLLTPSHNHVPEVALRSWARYVVGKLTRWDAIYYVQIANRGYVFEQEWAFGWGFTRTIALGVAALKGVGISHFDGLEAVVAVCIAHIAHLLSVLLLFNLTLAVLPASGCGVAFVTSVFHVLSPAGLFLSAPFAESSCAFLTFAGCLLFAKSLPRNGNSTLGQDILVCTSGVVFGIASTFRSNGILNGLLLLEEAFRVLFRLKDGLHLAIIRRLIATGVGGLSVAAGFILPQYIAYTEYCNPQSSETRVWCQRTIPSIYTFVQDHYWNVGLFRYWTISNLPLFALATPMSFILISSGLWALTLNPNFPLHPSKNKAQNSAIFAAPSFQIIRNLAVSQLLLVILTLTTAHVQIITRISSAYPVWLWYAAVSLAQGDPIVVQGLTPFVIMYAVIQGGLFASFLPPA